MPASHIQHQPWNSSIVFIQNATISGESSLNISISMWQGETSFDNPRNIGILWSTITTLKVDEVFQIFLNSITAHYTAWLQYNEYIVSTTALFPVSGLQVCVNCFSSPDEVSWTFWIKCFAEATCADRSLKMIVATSTDDTDAVIIASLTPVRHSIFTFIIKSYALTGMHLLVSSNKASVIFCETRLSAFINRVTMVWNSILIWSCTIWMKHHSPQYTVADSRWNRAEKHVKHMWLLPFARIKNFRDHLLEKG